MQGCELDWNGSEERSLKGFCGDKLCGFCKSMSSEFIEQLCNTYQVLWEYLVSRN